MIGFLREEINRSNPTDQASAQLLRTYLSSMNLLQQVFPQAKDDLKSMTQSLFKKFQDEVDRQPLVESLHDDVSRQLIMNILRKLNIFIDTLDISAFLANDEQGAFELGYVESMCSWSITEFAQKFPLCLV